jgi:hypothetical protein
MEHNIVQDSSVIKLMGSGHNTEVRFLVKLILSSKICDGKKGKVIPVQAVEALRVARG